MVKIHAGNKGWRVLVINMLTMYILNPEILSKFSQWGGSKIMICQYKKVKNIDKAVMFLWWLLKVPFKLFKGDRHTYIYIYLFIFLK